MMHCILGVMAALLIGIGWFVISPTQHAPASVSNGQGIGVVPAAQKKSRANLTAEERRAALDALQALQSLRSVTEAGLNYTEYSRRVLDGKVQVDRYINASGGNQDLKTRMTEAEDLYLFAGAAWNAKIREAYTDVIFDRRIALCPTVQTLRDEATSSQYLSLEEVKGIRVASSVPLIWGCASAKVRELEQDLSQGK